MNGCLVCSLVEGLQIYGLPIEISGAYSKVLKLAHEVEYNIDKQEEILNIIMNMTLWTVWHHHQSIYEEQLDHIVMHYIPHESILFCIEDGACSERKTKYSEILIYMK